MQFPSSETKTEGPEDVFQGLSLKDHFTANIEFE